MTYKIRIENEYVDVTKDVYEAYYRMKNHEDYLERRDKRKQLLHYHGLDIKGMSGEDIIPDKGADVLDRKSVV